jgi:hypothetical protein
MTGVLTELEALLESSGRHEDAADRLARWALARVRDREASQLASPPEPARPTTPRDWARHLRAALAPDAKGQLVLHRRDIQGLALVLEGLVATVAQLEGYVQVATDEAAKLRRREVFARRGETP